MIAEQTAVPYFGAMLRPVLLKLSGEALAGGTDETFDDAAMTRISAELVQGAKARPVAIVVGGGNIIRGRALAGRAADPVRGDYMGMLATIINSLGLVDAIERAGGKAMAVAPALVPNVARAYDRVEVRQAIANGTIVVFGGGTGHPFFTTDTCAALRAAEIGAEALLKGSTVDGVYSADPRKDPKATRFDRLTFDQAIEGRYQVMDATAFALCREKNIPIRVFDMRENGSILAALGANPPGTLVG